MKKVRDIESLLNAKLSKHGKKEIVKKRSNDPFEEVGGGEEKKVKLKPVKFKRRIEPSAAAPPAEEAKPPEQDAPKHYQMQEEKKSEEKKHIKIDPSKIRHIKKVIKKEDSPDKPAEPLPLAPAKFNIFKKREKKEPNFDILNVSKQKEESFPYKPSVPITRPMKKEDIFEKMKEVKKVEDKPSDGDEYGDDFEEYKEEEGIASIQKAIKRENIAAKRFFQKQEVQEKPTGNFTKAVIIPNTRPVDHAARIEQERRLDEIKGKVDLMEEAFEPVFEIKPERKQDRYYKRLAKGGIKNTLSQTGDDSVPAEAQTEIREFVEIGQCAPYDYFKNFNSDKTGEVDPIKIERFLEKMLPLIENALSRTVEEDLGSSKAKKSVVEKKGKLEPGKEIMDTLGASRIFIENILIGKGDPTFLAILYSGKSEKETKYIISLFSMLSMKLLGNILSEHYPITTFSLIQPDDKLIVTGNTEGELSLYQMTKQVPIYTTYIGHKASISSLSVRSTAGTMCSALIISVDVLGTVCFWRVDPVTTIMETELILGEYKLQIMETLDLADQNYLRMEVVPTLVEIDPKDSNSYILLTQEGIFKNSRILSLEEVSRKYEFKDMLFTRPTTMAISDEGLFLVGFESGALAIYSQHYTIPLTVWQDACQSTVWLKF